MTDIEISIGDELSGALTQAIVAAGDLTKPMGEIANAMRNFTLDNFRFERDPDGVAWKITQRKKDNPSAKILVKTTGLIGSIIGRSGRDFASYGSESSGNAAIIAKIHQLGGKISARAGSALRTPFGPRKSVTIPRRSFVGFNGAQRAFTLDALRDHLASALGAPTKGAAS